MYRHFGGKLAVEAMSWTEYWYGLQLLAEERIGTLIRQEAAREDAAFQQAITPEFDE